jgi:hypothetical protein
MDWVNIEQVFLVLLRVQGIEEVQRWGYEEKIREPSAKSKKKKGESNLTLTFFTIQE